MASLAGVIVTAAALEDVTVFAHSAVSGWTYPLACCDATPYYRIFFWLRTWA